MINMRGIKHLVKIPINQSEYRIVLLFIGSAMLFLRVLKDNQYVRTDYRRKKNNYRCLEKQELHEFETVGKQTGS